MTEVRSYLKDLADAPAKKRKRLPPKSQRVILNQPLRDACRRAVWERAGGNCEYAELIPEVRCGSPFHDRPTLEVDEIRGGSFRCTEQYDPERCRLACQQHHDFKSANKRLVLERLEPLTP